MFVSLTVDQDFVIFIQFYNKLLSKIKDGSTADHKCYTCGYHW